MPVLPTHLIIWVFELVNLHDFYVNENHNFVFHYVKVGNTDIIISWSSVHIQHLITLDMDRHLKKISKNLAKEKKILVERKHVLMKALEDLDKTLEKRKQSLVKSTQLRKLDDEIEKLEKVSTYLIERV